MGKIKLNTYVENLKISLKDTENPSIIAIKISCFITDTLKENLINLYGAYLLNWEVINFRRKSYVEFGWKGKVRISTCLAILNQYMLTRIFKDNAAQNQLKKWGQEALKFYERKRTHYIMDRYEAFLNIDNSDLLKELLDTRNGYENLGFDDGPFHNEEFPYDFYNPEKILLENSHTVYEKTIDEKIENLIIELNLI